MPVRLVGYYCPQGHLHEGVAYMGRERSQEMMAHLVEEMRKTGTLELVCRECGVPITKKNWKYLDTEIHGCHDLDEFESWWRDCVDDEE